jgi:hypothetical protein
MSTQSYVANAEKTSGWTGFAAVVLYAVGFFRIIEAIAYFANSHKINNLTGGLFGGQNWAWGLWDLIIAVLAIMAASSVMKGGVWGRLFGYLWGAVVIVQSLVIVGYAPWFAALSIALAIAVIYGLGVAPLEDS